MDIKQKAAITIMTPLFAASVAHTVINNQLNKSAKANPANTSNIKTAPSTNLIYTDTITNDTKKFDFLYEKQKAEFNAFFHNLK